jgi:hypothetical protein
LPAWKKKKLGLPSLPSAEWLHLSNIAAAAWELYRTKLPARGAASAHQHPYGLQDTRSNSHPPLPVYHHDHKGEEEMEPADPRRSKHRSRDLFCHKNFALLTPPSAPTMRTKEEEQERTT